MFKREKGFTLIELIMVIVLLGLLAVVAIPQFTNLQTEAKQAATLGVVGGVRSGIYTKYAANLAQNVTPYYPATLGGTAAICSVANPCFGSVLSQPVTQDWTCTTAGLVYTGPNGTSYTYTPGTGVFQ
jgi:prepilin-type N-terminal cleavage/methylation domain-containing protein